MNQPVWAQQAIKQAISRVRFEDAVLRLPGTDISNDDTDVIREATRLYTETWVVPLLEAVRAGNRKGAELLTRC